MRTHDYRAFLARTVLVQIHGEDEAIHGTLVFASDTTLVLENAALVMGGREPTPLDGSVVVERSSVRWVQVS